MKGNTIKNKALSMSEGYPASERRIYQQGFIEGSCWMIDKAREWFEHYLMEIGHPDDWLRDSPNMMSGEKRFREAMEE